MSISEQNKSEHTNCHYVIILFTLSYHYQAKTPYKHDTYYSAD